jgi:hypothetical protein
LDINFYIPNKNCIGVYIKTLQKKAIVRGFLSHLAGVYNLHELFCGSFENCRLMVSHRLFAAVFCTAGVR